MDAEQNIQLSQPMPPQDENYWYSLGIGFIATNDFNDAIPCFLKAIAMKPSFYEATFNLAGAYSSAGQTDKAMQIINDLVSVYPHVARGWYHLGYLHELKGEHAAAAVLIDRACELDPRNPVYRWDRCQNFLSMGDFVKGWELSEARMSAQKKTDFMRDPVIPYYEGQDLTDKTLLVWSEQGAGEQLMCASMLSEIIPFCKKVILEIDERFVGLMRRSFPEIEVYSAWQNGDRVDAYSRSDYQIPALTLGRFVRQAFEDFPIREEPYIKVDSALINAFRAKYEPLAEGRPIIGIAWKSTNKERANVKSVPVAALAPIYNQNAFFVSLQYAEDNADKADGGKIFRDPTIEHYSDFDVVIAQIAAMDAVVTTSNTILHAAGSIGMPTMAILNGSKWRHWYWFLRRTDCPWYPSVNLFRPEPLTDGDTWYATSISRIAARIAEVIAT